MAGNKYILIQIYGLIMIILLIGDMGGNSSAQPLLPFQLMDWEERLEKFPCGSCHADMPIESVETGTELEEHANIILRHGGLQCFDCHCPENRDFLKALDHREVNFSHMEEICGICHSSDYQDWKKGFHGKLCGSWKERPRGLRCVECHNVHAPKPIVLKPEKAPELPPH